MTDPAVLERARQLKTRARVEVDFPYFLRWCSITADEGISPFRPYWYQDETAHRWQAMFDAKQHTIVKQGEVVLKARQIGWSWLAAAFKYWVAAYHPGVHVGYSSYKEDEVKYHFLHRLKFIHEQLREDLQSPAQITATQATFENGSTISGFPSTRTAGVSRTLRLHVMDEAALHEYGQENFEAVVPSVMPGGMVLVFSTANPEDGPNGFFYDTYWNSRRGLMEGYNAFFYPWWVRPPRFIEEDGERQPNMDWLRAELSQYSSRPEQFAAWYPSTEQEAFVGKAGLVFPNGPPVALPPCDWRDYKWRVAGVDFGGGDPTAVVSIGITSTQHFHQHGEFYSREPVGLDDIAGYLLRQHEIAPYSLIACDPSQRTAIETLRGLGLPAEKAINRREGIDIVRTLHDNHRFTISEECHDSIHEYDGYRWATRRDPHDKKVYKTDTPVDNHADAHDARRYALVTSWKRLPQASNFENYDAPRRRGFIFR